MEKYRPIKIKFNMARIRKANIKDLQVILKLNHNLLIKGYRDYDKSLDLKWTNHEGAKYFKLRIQKEGFIEVAEVDNKIVGYLCGGISERKSYREKAKYAELENMFIKKEYRGHGIGSKLTRDFLKWCKENKVDYVAVIASIKNKRAINF